MFMIFALMNPIEWATGVMGIKLSLSGAAKGRTLTEKANSKAREATMIMSKIRPGFNFVLFSLYTIVA